jgi:hypothetical protein
MGVSHPTLEAIRDATAADPYKLSTKLTGAGGGGCAVTLLPDDFATSALHALVGDLAVDGFTAYTTSVGGSGLGVLSPWNVPKALATPPESPNGEGEPSIGWGGEGSLRAPFETTPVAELAQWADERGRWLFV